MNVIDIFPREFVVLRIQMSQQVRKQIRKWFDSQRFWFLFQDGSGFETRDEIFSDWVL